MWKSFVAFFRKSAVRKTGYAAWITVKWLFLAGIVSGFLIGGVAFGYVSALVKDEPVRSKELILEQINENIITGFVYFNDETVVGQLRTEEDRRLATLSDIPQKMLDSVLAIEDNRFYEHYGVDFVGFVRAGKQYLLKEDVQTGGSTITQQLARRVFLNLDREISRKFKEVLLAIRLERVMSKDEILLAYMNKIPYGNGANGYVAYGIKAAAKGIFDVDDLNNLSIAQCAYLAGIPQLPSNYSAFTSKGEFDSAAFKRALGRQQLVLKRMLQENRITEDQYQEALKFDLQSSLAKPSKKAYTTYPYLMLETERKAAEILVKLQYPNLTLDTESKKNAYNEALKDARAQLLRGGYHIYTTIDKTIYDSMQTIAQNPKNFTPDDAKKGMEQIGALMIDNKSGGILGMMEGRDFYKEQLNHATQAYRQPGSTMKPVAAFIPALEKGAIQPASVIDDVPIILPDGVKGVHIPENWDNNFHGLVTARHALNQSYNIPAIKLFLYSVGINEAWDYAKRMGITSITKEDYVAQTGVIGGLHKGVSVQELTGAYTTIPNKGMYYDAYMISKIVDGKGKTIFEHEKKPSRIYSEQTAYLMEDMLRTVITSGTANDLLSKFKYNKQVAISGKTGSTQDDADAWFMGFTPDITVGVWAGYDQPINKLSKATGGTNRAKNIWALVMNEAFEKKPELFPNKKFERPEDIVEMTVSSLSGKLPNELTAASSKLNTDLFNKKYVPVQEDDVLVKAKYISYNGANYLPHPNTPDDFLQEKVVIQRETPIGTILNKVQEAMQVLPQGKRKSIDGYVPLDADNDAPQETDPRSDDGKAPAAPANPLLTHNGDSYRISFDPISASDLIGYRLYRGTPGGSFQKVPGKIILAGHEPIFTDTPGSSGVHGYYVTAVDVAGRESQQSKIVFSDGSVQNMLGLPFDPNEAPQTGNAAGSSDAQHHGDNQPAATKAPAAPTGLKVGAKGMAAQLTWSSNPADDKVKQYEIYFSDKENGTYQKLGTSTGTEFIYYAPSDQGYFRIHAVNDKGESAPSAAVLYKK